MNRHTVRSRRPAVASLASRLAGLLSGLPVLAMAQVASSGPAEPVVEGIDEVVVTAERRESTIQRSSLSLQVVAPEDLVRAGVIQPQDLTNVVPGLQLSQYGPLTQAYIRGVGDSAGNPTAVSPVAWNIDGVYVARSESIGTSLFDVERIEVLKGPQGTLYGRNASGGAINILSRRPVLNEFSGYANLEAGSYRFGRLESAVNLPLGSTTALRVALNAQQRDGYLSDGTSDVKQQSGRMRLLWQPSDDLSLLVNVDAAHLGGRGAGFTYLPRRPGADPWEGVLSGAAQDYLLSYLPIIVPSVTPRQDADFWNASAELTWKHGISTFTVLPAFRHVDYDNIGHSGFVVGQRATSNQSSLELRWAGEIERANWVTGLYYFRELEAAKTRILASPLIQDIDIFFRPDTRSYAAFGQATINVTPTLRAIAGARYTSDERSMDGRTQDYTLGFPRPFSGSKTFTKTTGKVGLEYDLAPKNMVYATVSTGFKSGGINQEVAPNVFLPERLTSFEVGSRNRFLDDRLQVNAEIYYWKYRDRQETTITLDNSFFVNLIVENAGQATLKGANIDIVAKPWRNGRIHGFVEYNRARYDSYVYTTVDTAYGVPFFDPRSTGCKVGDATPGELPGSTFRSIDCSGFPLPRSPEWTGTLGYTHEITFGNGGELTLDATGQFASSRYLWQNFIAVTRAKPYTTLDLSGTYALPGGHWSASVFARNVTNETVYQGGFVNPYIATLFAATINPPRTFGARVSYSF